MSILTEALVVNITLGIWQGYRLDKEASRAVTLEASAELDAARVNKHLLPKEALKPIVSASSAIRTHFYANTLPWKDNGDRLLTRKLYMPFVEEHGRLVEAFNEAVDTFLRDDYPAAISRAEFRMGDLFDINDYPSADVLRHRFYANLDIDSVTSANDFRVVMSDSEVERIRGGMEEAMQQRIGRAMLDLWGRLAETLGHFARKMASDEIFRDTTLTNLKEIVELLPALNVFKNPELEEIRADVEAMIYGVEPKDLRKNPAIRTEVADEAQKIIGRMNGFMKGFSGMQR